MCIRDRNQPGVVVQRSALEVEHVVGLQNAVGVVESQGAAVQLQGAGGNHAAGVVHTTGREMNGLRGFDAPGLVVELSLIHI